MLLRAGFGLGLFVGSLALGWWLRRQGTLTEDVAAHLTRWLVIVVSPITLGLSFWQMNLFRLDPWLLPFAGFLLSASTLLPAIIYARRAELSRPEAGSFLTCAFFSNVGYFGAFTAFALFGEGGYALCMLYLVFFSPCFYTLGFWIASRYGGAHASSSSGAAAEAELRLYPFLGMLAGMLLSAARVPRPVPLEWLNQALIPIGTSLYLTTIGSQITFESPRPWLKPCLMMSGIKFLYTPLIAWALLSLFHIQGLARIVVLIEASTPVAVSPLVLPLLFGLDRKLANAVWLWTTGLAIPWFLLLIPLLPRL